MRSPLLFILVLSLLAGCKKNTPDPSPVPPLVAEETKLDVMYFNDPSTNMNIYLPANRSSSTTKVIILIHGGGWTSGDKTDYNSFVDTLKKRLPGYAIFNINYRLAAGSNNQFPTQENDVKLAIEYIYYHRDEFKISTTWVLLGASAGGHLAMLQAYKNVLPIQVKAVVDFFGPADLVDMYNNPASIFAPPSLLSSIIGATPSTNLSLYTQSSPITFVSATSPPTIILQGGVDPLVSPNQSIALKNKLQTAGVINQYVFYPTESHGWTGANMVDSFDKITAFLTANVH
ncbi:MAG: alpha/beta hydrolase [Chitinophagaceae bacterium]|nr:alpha/beta hydrolase [Chitinophagaceae bacterium]